MNGGRRSRHNVRRPWDTGEYDGMYGSNPRKENESSAYRRQRIFDSLNNSENPIERGNRPPSMWKSPYDFYH
jgi:hypothetical protein